MTPSPYPLASQPLPIFFSSPGGTDCLLIGMAILLVVFVLAVGLIYLRLLSLPGQIASEAQKAQYEFVCVLSLLALFTQRHIFWIAGLILAYIDLPDFLALPRRISVALGRIAANGGMALMGRAR
jgi:hypothetical protein